MSEHKRLSSVDLSGNLGSAIWQIAWPVMTGQLLYTMLTVVDMFWVGRLGAATVAAVALGALGEDVGAGEAVGETVGVVVGDAEGEGEGELVGC